MSRRTTLLLAGLTMLVCAQGCSAPRDAAPTAGTRTRSAVDSLADEYVHDYFAYRPEDAVLTGAPYGDGSRVVDNSISSIAKWRTTEDGLLARAVAINPDNLGERDWVTYGLLRENLEGSIGLRICKFELWTVDPSPHGWLSAYTEVADLQPLGTDTLERNVVRRTAALPAFLDTEVVNLRAGLTQGLAAPKVLVHSVISQIDDLLKEAPSASAFAAGLKRDSAPQFKEQLVTVIGTELYPAMKRYRDFLEKEYLPKARTSVGLSAMPNGTACYRASVRQNSSLDIAPDSIHRLGLAQVDRIATEMRTIANRDFKTTDVPALLRRLRTDTAFTFHTRDEIRDTARAAIARAQAALPKWFGIVPKGGVVVRDYPEFREVAGAIGENLAPEKAGRPSVFLINTYDPTHKPRASFEALSFHEGVPGHGLQGATALELGGAAHPITRYFYTSGYVEGWALYAEGLAEEMGLYAAPLGRLGLRASQSARASRLVVDPAIHTMGWTRDQAVTYMKAHTTWDDRLIEAEVNRYIAWPGQATSYMLGQMEFLTDRQMAKDSLGARFDIR
ncbi:MAG: DUF885 domain-containing protein [bacterium]